MANQGKGNFGDTEEHQKAGHAGGTATAQKQGQQFYKNIGHKGGKAAQKSGHAHELTDEERSKGGQVSSSEQDMSELGHKGGQR